MDVKSIKSMTLHWSKNSSPLSKKHSFYDKSVSTSKEYYSFILSIYTPRKFVKSRRYINLHNSTYKFKLNITCDVVA